MWRGWIFLSKRTPIHSLIIYEAAFSPISTKDPMSLNDYALIIGSDMNNFFDQNLDRSHAVISLVQVTKALGHFSQSLNLLNIWRTQATLRWIKQVEKINEWMDELWEKLGSLWLGAFNYAIENNGLLINQHIALITVLPKPEKDPFESAIIVPFYW